LSFSRNIKDSSSVYKYRFIFGLELPFNIETLRCFQPIFDGNVVDFIELGLAIDIE